MKLFHLVHTEARRRAVEAVQTAPDGYRVSVEPQKRSHEANDKLHAMLQEIAEAVQWHGQRLTVEEWKRLFTAALFREKMLPGMEGGIVIVPKLTRGMSKAEFSELIEFVQAWAAQNVETV